MNLELLRSFVAVAETGGITKAEERIHRTQSTISQQIARLEGDLQTVLFDRTKRAVQLTERGQQYLDYARRILALDQESRALIRDEDLIRVLRIGVSDNYSRYGLADRMIEFTQANPSLRLSLKTDQSGILLTQMQEGHLDLTICNELVEPETAEVYSETKLHWYVARDRQIHHEHPLPIVLYPPGCAYRTRALSALEAMGRPWRVAIETSDWGTICMAVRKGMGVALLDHYEDMELVRQLSPADGLPATDPVYLTLRRSERARRDEAVGEFARALHELIRPKDKSMDGY